MTGEGFGKAEVKATGLGSTLTKFAALGGAALAVVGYESIKMASKFDASMEMLHTQAGVPQAAIGQLKAGVLALASQVGQSPDSLAESLYHVASNMASLGAKGPQMLNVVKVAAEGARVGGADLVDVTNALTAAVASGIPGVQNYSQAMGALNATVGAGDMKMQDLAEAFGTGMVAVVKGYGLSLKDVGAALATFGDNNIRGAHAGTLLKMTVASLAVPSAGAKKQLAELGITTTTLANDMQHGGLLAAIEDLNTRLHKAGLTAQTAGPLLTTLFTKKSGPGIAILLDQLDRFKSKYSAITDGANQFGDAWQKTLAQTSTVFAQLKGWLDALMISIGERVIPVVKAFGEFLLNNKTAVQVTLLVIAGLVAVLGTYVVVVKAVTLATEIWGVVQKILNRELTLSPIGLVVTALALLTIGLMEAYKHSKAFRDAVHDVGVIAKEAFGWVLNAAREVFDWIRSHWPLILGILMGPIGLAVAWIVTHWRTVMQAAGDVVDFVKGIWGDMEQILIAPIESAYNTIMGWFNSIANFVGGIPGMVQNAVNSIPVVGGVLHSLGLAHGGITGAAGGGPRGGFTMVGEYGPELVRMPYGSQVYSSAQSAGMLGAGGGGGGGVLQLELVGGGDDLLIRWLRQAIRVRGGNVQKVLGAGS